MFSFKKKKKSNGLVDQIWKEKHTHIKNKNLLSTN